MYCEVGDLRTRFADALGRISSIPNNCIMFTIQNIVKIYGGRAVLNGVSFSAEDRKITYILGTSGSGTSTLLKIMICAVRYMEVTATFQSCRQVISR